ncbi:MAG: hypothetical protein WCW30_04880, partial [Candidatus Gracilibacteria bacterium]
MGRAFERQREAESLKEKRLHNGILCKKGGIDYFMTTLMKGEEAFVILVPSTDGYYNLYFLDGGTALEGMEQDKILLNTKERMKRESGDNGETEEMIQSLREAINKTKEI